MTRAPDPRAVTITPLAGRSVLGFAPAALVLVLMGASLWWWHVRTAGTVAGDDESRAAA